MIVIWIEIYQYCNSFTSDIALKIVLLNIYIIENRALNE